MPTKDSTPENEIPAHILPLACRRCGAIDTPRLTPGAGPHTFAAHCTHCNGFIQWLSRYSPQELHERRRLAGLEAMRKLPPSEAQLDYLKALGDTAQLPTSMGDASQRIDTLLKQRKGECL